MDTSALVAILREEPEHTSYASAVMKGGAIIGTPSILEARMVMSNLPPSKVDGFFDRLFDGGRVVPVDFTSAMVTAAADAFRRYGKGRGHPARLNFGDCMSYAVAKVRGVPLLFKGGDFALTDIEPAWRP